jgi:dUTP pyrophosphatase
MKIKLDGGIMPTRAHPYDAGLDLYTPKDVTIPGCKYLTSPFQGYGKAYCGSRTVDTGVCFQIPEGYVGYIKSKSGLLAKHGLFTDGTIDAHYTGTVRVTIFNTKPSDYIFKAGEKIAQLVIQPCLLPELEVVDELEETDRGEGGFGSTGK